MKNFLKVMGSALATFVLSIGISSANSACVLFLHQPKVPEGMNQFKK